MEKDIYDKLERLLNRIILNGKHNDWGNLIEELTNIQKYNIDSKINKKIENFKLIFYFLNSSIDDEAFKITSTINVITKVVDLKKLIIKMRKKDI